MSRPLKVWLVEYAHALPAATTQEGNLVRSGIQTRLQGWFQRVVQHASAQRNQPAGFGSNARVLWTARPAPADVDARDVVIHFDPSAAVAPGGITAPSQVLVPYRAAAGRLPDQELSTQLSSVQRAMSGGRTIRASIGNDVVPTLSIVFVLYDRQFSTLRLRVNENVESLSLIAFHEAAHNKDDTNSLHTAGGGGIFADIHTGGLGAAQQPNQANVAFLAERIWNWGPQFIVGQPLTPVTRP